MFWSLFHLLSTKKLYILYLRDCKVAKVCFTSTRRYKIWIFLNIEVFLKQQKYQRVILHGPHCVAKKDSLACAYLQMQNS